MIEVKPPSHIDFVSVSFFYFLSQRISMLRCHLISICIELNRVKQRIKKSILMSYLALCLVFLSLHAPRHRQLVTQYHIVYLLSKIKSSNQQREKSIVKEMENCIESLFLPFDSNRITIFFFCSLQLKQNPCCES